MFSADPLQISPPHSSTSTPKNGVNSDSFQKPKKKRREVPMAEKMAADGGGMAEELSDGMHCSDHPYRRNPSGVCAFCLQEKLGDLVSSKSSDPFSSIPPPPTSCSSPPSSDSTDLPYLPPSRKSFLSAKHRYRAMETPTASAAQSTGKIVSAKPVLIDSFCLQEKLGNLVSSKSSDPFPPPTSSSSPPSSDSTDLPSFPPSSKFFLSAKHRHRMMKTPAASAPQSTGKITAADSSDSPRKKSLWSFFTFTYSSSSLIPYFGNKRRSPSFAGGGDGDGDRDRDLPKIANDDAKTPRRQQSETPTVNDEPSPSGSHASSSFARKVSRSRSVGCGSRSFSGDFLERISNGFGDCTLRRVESHRENKSKIRERVKCGSVFVGVGAASSSSYWISAADSCSESCCLQTTKRGSAAHGFSRSWGWAFASPMRVFRAAAGGGAAAGGKPATVIAAGAGGILAGGVSQINQFS